MDDVDKGAGNQGKYRLNPGGFSENSPPVHWRGTGKSRSRAVDTPEI